MSIRTTINMNVAVKKKIADAARTLNTSQKDIVVMLLHCMLKDYKKLFFTDERKFYKISVSKLVAMATELYLEKLLNSNVVRNYVVLCDNRVRIEGTIPLLQWIITWDHPKLNKLKELLA